MAMLVIPIAVLFSCRTTPPVVTPDIVPVVVPEKDNTETAADTVRPPAYDIVLDTIDVETDVELDIKRDFKVAVLLPFSLDKYNYNPIDLEDMEFSRATQMAIEFYQGFKMAVEEVGSIYFNAEFFVFDTKNSEAQTKAILKKSPFPDVDMMIGPIYNKNLRIAADYCKQNLSPSHHPPHELDECVHPFL